MTTRRLENTTDQGLAQACCSQKKGTAGEPGRNVNAKSCLNSVILNNCRATPRRKLDRTAATVITVKPAYTTRTRVECGTADSSNCNSQAGFHRVVCRHADLNAAMIMLASGVGVSLGRRAFASAASATREFNSEAA